MKSIQKFFLSFLLTMSLVTIPPLNAGWFLAWLTGADSKKLIAASANNDGAAVRHLLSKRFIDLNAENNYHQTALIAAAYAGHQEIVTLLIAAGASLNHVNKNGGTALMSAVEGYNSDIAEFLLDQGATVNNKQRDGSTALLMSAERGFLSVVRNLLTADADFTAQTWCGSTALIYAAQKGHREVVDELLAAGATIPADNSNGWLIFLPKERVDDQAIAQKLQHAGALTSKPIALMLAIHRGDLDTTKDIIASGIDVNIQDENGITPLMLAVRQKHAALVEYLLSLPDMQIEKRAYTLQAHHTALMDAASESTAEIVHLLISARACVNAGDICGGTPLIQCITRFNTHLNTHRAEQRKIAQLLIAAGASLDVPSYHPLHCAIHNNTLEMVDLLITAGSDGNHAYDFYGNTPLIEAIERGYTAIVERLLASPEIEVNAYNNYGKTALIRAVEKNYLEGVRLLVAHNADRTLVNKRGETALAIATSTPGICHEIVEILEACVHGGEGEEEEIMVKPAV